MSNTSIRKRLTWLLLITISLASLISFITVFYFSYQEAQEFQDETLHQIGLLQTLPTSSVHAKNNHDEQEYQLEIILLNSPNRPTWLNPNLSAGFHELMGDKELFRVWVSNNNPKQRLAVIQPTSERDEIAFHSALRTLLPMLLLLPLVLFVFLWSLRRELASIETLAHKVDNLLIDNIPESLPSENIPHELSAFIAAINRLLGRLHNAFMQQKRFTADAAHELRTPLAALSLQIQNVEQAETLAEMQQRLIPLKAGVKRSVRLAEQLLDINRMQSAPIAKHGFSLNRFLNELLALYIESAEAKSIDLGLEIHQEITLNSNPEALMLILGNALDNAIKYTPENGCITLKANCQAEEIHIEIEDNGPGLVTSELQQVFEPFVRATESAVAGNGLGLAIALSAAEQLGATIVLQTAPTGSGLIFKFQQPACYSTSMVN